MAKDIGTAELHKNQVVVESKRGGNPKVVSTIPIDYYFHRGWIERHQYESADYFYFLWYYGAEKSRYVLSRNPLQPRTRYNPGRAEEMEQEYNQARKAIGGEVNRKIVYDVVCIGEWANRLNMQLTRQTCMKRLKDGLDDLASHFGIPME